MQPRRFSEEKKKVKSKTHNVVTCSDTFVIDFRLGVEEWVCSMSFEWDNKSVSEKEGGGGEEITNGVRM